MKTVVRCRLSVVRRAARALDRAVLRTSDNGLRTTLITLVLVLVLLAPSSYACSVCYGSTPAGPQVNGMNNAILFLLGIIGAVQVGFVALFLSFRKRARTQARRRESFRLIEGGYH